MLRMIRPFAVFLAGVLVTAVLIGFAPGDEPAAKAALGPVQAVTLAAADFHPSGNGTSYDNYGWAANSDGALMGRIPFPAETVVLTSAKVRVSDNRSGANICAFLYRARPGDTAEDTLGQDCTVGTSTQTPQTLSITSFTRIGRFHTAYLWIVFDTYAPTLTLYGATVFYRVVS